MLGNRYKKGSQVYITYGRCPNRELMLYYGFCISMNKHNYAQFRMKLDNEGKKLENIYKRSVAARAFPITKNFTRRFRLYYQQFNTCKLLNNKFSNNYIFEDKKLEVGGTTWSIAWNTIDINGNGNYKRPNWNLQGHSSTVQYWIII